MSAKQPSQRLSFSELFAGSQIRRCLHILGWCWLALTPMVIASLVLPERAAVIVVLVTSWILFYPLTAKFQDALYEVSLKTANAFVAVPSSIFAVIWVLCVLLLDNKSQVGATIFPAVLLLLVATSPLYRGEKSTRKKPLVPYKFRYGFAAAVVMAIEIYILWGLS